MVSERTEYGDVFKPHTDHEAILNINSNIDGLRDDIHDMQRSLNAMATKSYVDGSVKSVSDRLDDHIVYSNERLSMIGDKPNGEHRNGFVEFIESKVGFMIVVLLSVVMIAGVSALATAYSGTDTKQLTELVQQLITIEEKGGN